LIREAMRKLWRGLTWPFRMLWMIATWPFRLLGRLYRAARNFINQEPEDTPIAEVFVRTIEQPSVLIDHLEALRGHVLRSVAVLTLTVLASTLFTRQAIEFLAMPIGGIAALQAIEVTESIGSFMRVALLCGVAIAMPYIGIEAFAFINPGLRRRERITIPAVWKAKPRAIMMVARINRDWRRNARCRRYLSIPKKKRNVAMISGVFII